MARSPADGAGSKIAATTLIFPKKSEWTEAAEAKALAKKRSSLANGAFSKVLARLVEECHMDRKAAAIVLKLKAIEDNDDLHVTVHHMIDGLKKLGILDRAMAQEEMFDEHQIDGGALDDAQAALEAKPTTTKRRGRPPGGSKKPQPVDYDTTNVTHIGDAAARVVAEAVGE